MKKTEPQPLSALQYLFVAFVLLLISGIGLLLFVHAAHKLPERYLQDRFYYFLLLPWGLVCAAFLNGVMRSYALFSGKHLGGRVVLGGPAAVCFLVVVGGFWLVPRTETFDLTVRPHSADGKDPIITSGKITLDLDNDRRTEAVNAKGEADFKGIPAKFDGATVNILPNVDGYDGKPIEEKLEGNVLDLPLVRAQPVTLTGSIIPPPKKFKETRIFVDGQKDDTSPDELGRFELRVEGKAGDRVRLKVYADGNLVYDDFQTLPGPVTIKLHGPR